MVGLHFHNIKLIQNNHLTLRYTHRETVAPAFSISPGVEEVLIVVNLTEPVRLGSVRLPVAENIDNFTVVYIDENGNVYPPKVIC